VSRTKIKRAAPPELSFNDPDCVLCLNTVQSDGDGYYCATCKAYWPYDGREGAWENDDLRQCYGVKQPFLKVGPEHESIRTNEYRCLLDLGHEGDHRAEGFITWARQA
jgi:hypothetical protein